MGRLIEQCFGRGQDEPETHLRAALNHTSVRKGAVAENWNVISLASTPVHYYVTGTLDRLRTPLRSDSYPSPAYQLSSPKQNQFSGLEDWNHGV